MSLLILTLIMNAVLLGIVVWIFRPVLECPFKRKPKMFSRKTKQLLEGLHQDQE